MTSAVPAIASFLTATAIFWGAAGGKINSVSSSVKLSDEHIETCKKKDKSGQDLIIILAGGVVLAGVLLAITGTWYFAVMGLFGGSFILRWHKKKQEEERTELLKSQFADVLGQLESAMYGGLNPYQALEDAVPEMPRPARDVFYEVLRRTRTGDTLARALDAVMTDTGWEDLKALSVAVSLYNRVGCDLGEICRHSVDAYEDRESFRSILAASISQNMMTMKVLTGLPFLFVGFARVIAPGFADPLFHTIEGSFVFIFSTIWIVTGNILTRRMARNALGRGV